MARACSIVLCAVLVFTVACRAEDAADHEALLKEMAAAEAKYKQLQYQELQWQVGQLRKEAQEAPQPSATPQGQTEIRTVNKYGPDLRVTTKNGKLTIGGLLQVWYQVVQNQNVGIVNGRGVGIFSEPNELSDNDTFRIRRTELRFTMPITENVLAYVMLDPAREHNRTYLPLPTFPVHNAPLGNAAALATGAGLQSGNTIIPQLLQDAYINFHDVIPHHDFTIGQFKPPSGEEAWRNSGMLDFVERSMVTGINNVRDIGIMAHGTWFENRFQYWVGGFNGPDGTILSDPEIVEGGNRSDDNDAKDIAWRVAVRPVWSTDCWYGRLELGAARTDGWRGESGQGFDPTLAINGLNRQPTAVNRQSAWLWYRPGNEVRGWWVRSEWGSGRDRYAVRFRTNMLGLGSIVNGAGDPIGQANPAPVSVQGWYVATGYKLSDSIFAEKLKNGGCFGRALHDLEFAFRYEVYQNVATEDLAQPDRHTDQFKTQALTSGINYYIKGHDAKIQANYIIVDDPDSHSHSLREWRNNVFVVNFQVMF